MKRFVLVLLFSGLGLLSAQVKTPYGEATVFTFQHNGEEVNFLRVSTEPSLRRPVMVLCLGSFPAPLLIEEEAGTIIPYSRILFYDGLSEKYDLVLIGKPRTPPVMKAGELSSEYTVVTDLSDPYSFRSDFLENNYLEKHVEHTVAVLKYLKGLPWVDPDRILLMGHSQGAHIAAHVAYEYPEVAALGYFGGNPLGRFAQFIVEERYRELRGEATMEETQQRLDRRYERWRTINRGLAVDESGDPDRTWTSFSPNYINKMAALQVPVYVAYGTKDPGGHLCYLLPVYFELAGKTDYRMVPFPDRGHNFEEFTPEGKSDMDTSKWFEALQGFVAWSEALPGG